MATKKTTTKKTSAKKATTKKAADPSIIRKLTKYEKARLIGSRALQISMGAPFMIKLSEEDLAAISYNPIEIAKKELEQDKVPIDVVREVTEAKARG